jgi:hypothetical protein
MPVQPLLSPKSAQLISHQFSKSSVRQLRTKGRVHKGRKERRQKRSEENKNSHVPQTVEPHWTMDQISDATRADERFARIADEPASNHRGRNVALQMRRERSHRTERATGESHIQTDSRSFAPPNDESFQWIHRRNKGSAPGAAATNSQHPPGR